MVLTRVVPGLLGGLLLLLVGCQSGYQSAPVTEPAEPGVHGTPSPGSLPETSPRPAVPPPERGTDPRQPARLVLELEQRGDQLVAAGEWQQVIEVAEQGLRMDRRFSGFYRLLGEAYAGLGNLSQARLFARQATRLCGGDCAREQRLWRQLNP